jgi:hypothetical protein
LLENPPLTSLNFPLTPPFTANVQVPRLIAELPEAFQIDPNKFICPDFRFATCHMGSQFWIPQCLDDRIGWDNFNRLYPLFFDGKNHGFRSRFSLKPMSLIIPSGAMNLLQLKNLGCQGSMMRPVRFPDLTRYHSESGCCECMYV